MTGQDAGITDDTARDATTGTRRAGRRAGDSGTRETILSTALEMFAERGFDATSVRAIAKQAEVDPGLVRHYFGTKQQLFATAVVNRSDLGGRVADALLGPDDGIGERLVRTYLTLWESPETGPVMQTLFRSGVATPDLAPLFINSMLSSLRERSLDEASLARIRRIPLIAPQILGVAVCRYVMAVPMLADEPLDDLVARLAPEAQRVLEG